MSKVPAGVYKIHTEKNKDTGEIKVGVKLYKSKFDMPPVIFGEDLEAKAKLIIDTWNRYNGILGACSIGQKGTGKSTLVELAANYAINAGHACLLVDEPYTKQVVEEATRILGDCVFLGDEFEKIFSTGHGIGDELLTFFSDKSLGKVLFLITANDIRGLSTYMIHRPGRFLFKFEFEGVSDKVVKQICGYFKVNPKITSFISKHVAAVTESIDSVLALAKNGCAFKTTKDFKVLFDYLNVKKPSFKLYKVAISNIPAAEGLDKRFDAYLTDGKWNITDNVTGMTYTKQHMHMRQNVWGMWQNIDGNHVRFEVSFEEFSEPQEMQTEIPVTVSAKQ